MRSIAATCQRYRAMLIRHAMMEKNAQRPATPPHGTLRSREVSFAREIILF